MSEIKWWKPSWEWRKEVEALTQQLAEMTLRRAETLAMCDQLTQERDAYELKYDLIRNDQDYQQCCELRRLAYERLADMTAERDEAKCGEALCGHDHSTQYWKLRANKAKAKLAAQKHQGGLP